MKRVNKRMKQKIIQIKKRKLKKEVTAKKKTITITQKLNKVLLIAIINLTVVTIHTLSFVVLAQSTILF